ncbi:hypothetical protein HYH03_010139 [Edaphochlamys debaryana]|uniref:Uncharacterized protein n=1 Tax=Edaphochlamys debaryana TaxID=47281 RepID=A0A835Y015_9CHLO|nr:hypothetical protein HYH03_010139 [Edaphochlamys debaryana]|eukprot:KAG2491571.1 hypothetical protein HYH03_010139 [Edaphochlamys debaryana]
MPHRRGHPALPDICLLPFVRAPADACARLRELIIRCGHWEDVISGAALAGLLPRLPLLRTLRLAGSPDMCPTASVLAATAFSALPHLTHLHLDCYDWMELVPADVAARLTTLDVVCASPASEQAVTNAPRTVSRMASLRHLTLDFGGYGGHWWPVEFRNLLEELPATLERLVVAPVEVYQEVDNYCMATCSLEGGKLSEITLTENCCAYGAKDQVTLRHLASLLDCVLGPRVHRRVQAVGAARLRRLDLRGPLDLPRKVADSDVDIKELLSRVDEVSLAKLVCPYGIAETGMYDRHGTDNESDEGSDDDDDFDLMERVLEAVRLFGVPEELQWKSRVSGTVRLRPPSSGPSSGPQPPGGGARSTPRRTLPPPPAEVPLTQLVDRALGRMVRASTGPSAAEQATTVLLRGAFVEGLLGSGDAAVREWVERLASAVASEQPAAGGPRGRGRGRGPSREHRLCWYEALPSAKALVIACSSAAAAYWACAKAHRILHDAVGVNIGAWELLWTPLPLDRALLQTLQALWDGEEEGEEHGTGAGEDAGAVPGARKQTGEPGNTDSEAEGAEGAAQGTGSGLVVVGGAPNGAGAPASSVSAEGRCGGVGDDSRSEFGIARLQWLLETWEALGDLPDPVYLSK